MDFDSALSAQLTTIGFSPSWRLGVLGRGRHFPLFDSSTVGHAMHDFAFVFCFTKLHQLLTLVDFGNEVSEITSLRSP
jgi:hypothetical protein